MVNTVKSLTQYNHIIITLKPGNSYTNDLNDIDIKCINFTSKLSFFSSALQLRKVIKTNKIDIIHTHLYWATLIARIACIGVNIKFFFSLHTIMSKDSFDKSKLMLWLEKCSYTKKQIAIGVSNAVLNDYNSMVGIKGVSHVLYNFIEDSFFINNYKNKQTDGVFKLVAVANLKLVKNHIYLIEAFKHIDNSKFSLDIYGEGLEKEKLEKEVLENGLNIKILKINHQLSSILPLYDAFITASLYEGFGLAPLEAMATGLPTILSNINVFKEIANNAALFFNLKDVHSLTNILNKIANGKIDLDRLSKKGKKRAEIIAKKEHYLKKLSFIYNS